MSIHSSLRTNTKASGSGRNVLKRYERVRHMMTTGTWIEGRSALGLPKIKQLKMKSRKPAKEKEAAAEAAGEKPAAGAGAAS
jgi:small basic protein (TIGR04137 family)